MSTIQVTKSPDQQEMNSQYLEDEDQMFINSFP